MAVIPFSTNVILRSLRYSNKCGSNVIAREHHHENTIKACDRSGDSVIHIIHRYLGSLDCQSRVEIFAVLRCVITLHHSSIELFLNGHSIEQSTQNEGLSDGGQVRVSLHVATFASLSASLFTWRSVMGLFISRTLPLPSTSRPYTTTPVRLRMRGLNDSTRVRVAGETIKEKCK